LNWTKNAKSLKQRQQLKEYVLAASATLVGWIGLEDLVICLRKLENV